MSLASEAHLPPLRRSTALVSYLPRKRRSWAGWAIFAGLLILNEARGTYVAASFVANVLKAYHS